MLKCVCPVWPPTLGELDRRGGRPIVAELLERMTDAEIAWQATEMLTQILPAGPAGIKVTVHDGIVALTSAPGLTGSQDLLSLATRLTWDIDGVVDVVSRAGTVGRFLASAATPNPG